MNPANFPGRKDARRLGALSRLGNYPKTRRTPAEIDAEALVLSQRLNPLARGIRTKKLRGARRQAS